MISGLDVVGMVGAGSLLVTAVRRIYQRKEQVDREQAVTVYRFVPETADVAARFLELAKQWRAETAPLSSLTDISMHPCYQQIIGLGPQAVPLLLMELEKEPEHWFWALKAITGIDPVHPEDRGRIERMTEAWLAWGKEEGLI